MNFNELLRRGPSLHLKDGERDTLTGEAMRTAKTAKQIWPRGQRGVTLIELMIALVLTAIIGGALYQGLVSQSKTFIQQDQVSEAMQHCRTATEQILRELRMAGYSMAYIVGAPDNTSTTRALSWERQPLLTPRRSRQTTMQTVGRRTAWSSEEEMRCLGQLKGTKHSIMIDGLR